MFLISAIIDTLETVRSIIARLVPINPKSYYILKNNNLMAYIGTYYFNRLGKELLYYNRSIRAALAKYSVTKASSSSIAFSALSTTPTPYLPLFSSK